MSFPAKSQAADVSISAADSPLKNALDVYFDFMTNLMKRRGFGTRQKVLMNNTITSFDISADTPYYNQGLYRNFADRVISGSPADIGAANTAERFSARYEELINIANSKIDQNHPEIQTTLSGLNSRLTTQTNALVAKRKEIGNQWNDIVTSKGLKPTDADYTLQYISFLSSVSYSDQIKNFTKDIQDTLRSMDAVRRSVYSQWEQSVLDDFTWLSDTYKESRPLQPSFEISMKKAEAKGGMTITDLTFANPDYQVPSLFDLSPSLYPLGDLVAFLNNTGSRAFSITKSSTYTYKHDSQWSAGGNARFSLFGIGFGGSANASSASSYMQAISKLNTISGSFENIDEVFADRQRWFNPNVFRDPNVQKLIGMLPAFSALQYVSVSLIIARGLTLSLTFDSSANTNDWNTVAFSQQGGVSVLGYQFGEQGEFKGTTVTTTTSGNNKTVTFKDDPKLARIVAYRVEPFVSIKSDILSDRINNDPAFRAAFEKFKSGTMSYIDLQKAKLSQ